MTWTHLNILALSGRHSKELAGSLLDRRFVGSSGRNVWRHDIIIYEVTAAVTGAGRSISAADAAWQAVARSRGLTGDSKALEDSFARRSGCVLVSYKILLFCVWKIVWKPSVPIAVRSTVGRLYGLAKLRIELEPSAESRAESRICPWDRPVSDSTIVGSTLWSNCW